MLLSLSGFLFEDDYQSQSLSFDQFCRVARSAGYGGIELRDKFEKHLPKGPEYIYIDAYMTKRRHLMKKDKK